MRTDMMKRLSKLENQIAPGVQQVILFAEYGEPSEALDKKIERWKAGDTDTGVQCGRSKNEPYKGGDVDAIFVIPVKPGDIEREDQ